MIIDSIKHKGFSKEEYGYLFIYLVAFVPLIYKFISPFFIITGLNDLTIVINPFILMTGLLMAWKQFRNCIRTSDIVSYFAIGALLYMTCLVFPANIPLIENHYINFFLFVLSFYFVGLSIDYSKNKRVISVVARIGVWYNVYWQFLVYMGIVETNYSFDDSAGEQMGVAYHLLFCVLMTFVDLIRKVNIANIFYFGISTLMLTFMGARGPIMIFVAFVVVYLLLFHKFNRYNYITKIIIAILLIVFISFMEVIMMAIASLATSLGFSTRIFDAILENRMVDLSESSGRDDIWSMLIKAIQNDNNGIGYGWLGDRLLLGNDLYSHNFELEVLVHFGSIIGGIMLFLLFVLIIRSYINIRHSESRDFWLLMLFAGLIELQLSKTYIDHPLLFIMIGYFVSIRRKLSA